MKTKHTPGYEVMRDGSIFSNSNWRGYGRRELHAELNNDGYPSVRLTIDGKRTRYAVHVIVARHHLQPKPSDHHEIRHLDGNKMNPHADNLEWGTKQENADDREIHGRTSRGNSHSKAIKQSDHAAKVKRGAEHYKTKARSTHV